MITERNERGNKHDDSKRISKTVDGRYRRN